MRHPFLKKTIPFRKYHSAGRAEVESRRRSASMKRPPLMSERALVNRSPDDCDE